MASSKSQMCRQFFPSILLLLLASVPGVLCDDDYSIGGLAAASAVCFLLLAVIIAMIAGGLTWNNWYPKLQFANGKVKMPKAYWKKKEEAKLRLLHGSRSGLASLAAPSESGLPNGNTSSRVRDTGSLQASWVQGWNNANQPDDGGYEEMGLAMDLGEEEDVRIVTTILDNETLNQGTTGPLTTTSTTNGAAASASASPATRDSAGTGGNASVSQPLNAAAAMTAEGVDDPEAGDSYIYTAVDRSKKSSASNFTPRAEADVDMGGSQVSAGHGDDGDEGPAATSEKVTSFSKMDPYLVAL